MEAFTITSGREWEQTAVAGFDFRAGREWLRERWDTAAAALARSLTPERIDPRRTFAIPPTSSTGGDDGHRHRRSRRDDGATQTTISATTEPPASVGALPLGSMYHVVDQIGARQLWTEGITGAGVNVAVIDTGIADVPSLSGSDKVVAVVDLSAEAACPSTRFRDSNGHGTFMAGIIAGSTPGSSPRTAFAHPEQFLGVAPDAGIVSVKVSGRDGDITPGGVVDAVNWVIDNADDLKIRVLNLAYSSGSALPYEQDLLAATLERAWDAGIVVVTPAGNCGNDTARLESPAADPFVIAVGGVRALDTGFEIAEWSNRGDGVRNPDFVAPGAHIHSLRAPGSDADVNHPEGFVDDETFKGSGTSESAAVTSGVVALLLQAHPEWTNDHVKAVLVATATPIDGTTSELAGAGLIRADHAVRCDVAVGPQTWARSVAGNDSPMLSGPGFVSVLTDGNWSGMRWTGAHWTGAHWTGAHWTGAHWTGAHWTGAHWTGAHWTGAHWTGAHWTGAHWTGAHWT